MRISDWSSDVCSSDLRFKLLPHPCVVDVVERITAIHFLIDGRARDERARRPRNAQFRGKFAHGKAADGPIRTDQRGRAGIDRFPIIILAAEMQSGFTAEARPVISRSEEHTSELQSLMRISYAVFCLKKKKTT